MPLFYDKQKLLQATVMKLSLSQHYIQQKTNTFVLRCWLKTLFIPRHVCVIVKVLKQTSIENNSRNFGCQWTVVRQQECLTRNSAFLFYIIMKGEAQVAQRWERSPLTTMARVRFPDPAWYVSRVCWFSPVLRGFFSGYSGFPPSTKINF